MSKQILGLEIEEHALTAVLIQKDHKDLKLLAQAHIPFLKDTETPVDLPEAVRQLSKQMEIEGATCYTSIPSQLLSYRNIQLPFTDNKKISQVLPYELETSLPVAIDNLIIDFIAHGVPDNNALSDLLTVIAEKGAIGTFLHPLTENNIEPQLMTMSGYGAASWLINQPDTPQEFIFIHLKKGWATVFFIIADTIKHIRAFAVKTQHGSVDDVIISKIKQTLIAFDEMIDRPFEPQTIFLTGNHPETFDFGQDPVRVLGVPVQTINIADAQKIEMDSNQQQNWDAGLYDSALSLALLKGKVQSHFNFRKGQFEIKKRWGEHKQRIITTAILFGIALMFGLFNYFTEDSRLRDQINAYDTRIGKIFYEVFPAGAKKTDKPSQQLENQIEKLKASHNNNAEPQRKMLAIDILNEISRAIPKDIDVKLTNLVISVEHTLISGQTDSHNSVNTIKNNLEKVQGFSRVTIVKSELNKRGGGVQFKLKIQL